jgi:hypothetical protein
MLQIDDQNKNLPAWGGLVHEKEFQPVSALSQATMSSLLKEEVAAKEAIQSAGERLGHHRAFLESALILPQSEREGKRGRADR